MKVNMTKPQADSVYAAAAGLWLQGEQNLAEAQKGWKEAECGWGALRIKYFTKPLDTLMFIFLLQLKTRSYSWISYGENK